MRNTRLVSAASTALVLSLFVGPPVAWAQDAKAGEEIYKKRCAMCHSADGKGNAKMADMLKTKIPDLTAADVTKKSDADHLKVIGEGSGKMPGFAKSLKEKEQKDVLSYTKALGKK